MNINRRFDFQREAVRAAKGVVLNIGANEDPAGLKECNPNVINCDRYESHHGQADKTDFKVDCVFDAVNDRWPFENQSVDLVVLGDIVEHLWPYEFAALLLEAARVAENVCLTVPEDHRVEAPGYHDALVQDINDGKTAPGCCHVYAYTKTDLEAYLDCAGFRIVSAHAIDYGFVPLGHLIMAKKKGV